MNSKRVHFVLVMAAVGAIALIGPINQTLAENDSTAYGNKIAGSYLGTSTIFLGTLQVLMTFNGDGGYTVVNTASAGLGGTAPWASRPEAHGTWKRTGNREITATDLVFDYDLAGNHVSTPVITRILTFDKKFESFTATTSFKVFFPGDDPLDPDSIPFTTGTGTMEGRRIHATID